MGGSVAGLRARHSAIAPSRCTGLGTIEMSGLGFGRLAAFNAGDPSGSATDGRRAGDSSAIRARVR